MPKEPSEVQSEQAEFSRLTGDGPDRLTWAVLGLASLVSAVVVLLVPYIPGHDGPHHIYLAHLANHFSDPGSIYPRFYRPGVPVSALGYLALGAPLQDLFGWLQGYRVYWLILVQSWGWGTVTLFRSIEPKRTWLGIVGFAMAFQWSMYMGFYSFMFGAALGLFTIAIAVAEPSWSRNRRLAITGMLLAQAFAHVFAAELTAIVLIALVLARSERGAKLKQLGLLAVMGTPTMLVALAASGWVSQASPVVLSNDRVLIPLSWTQKLALAGHCFVGGPMWRSLTPVVLALLALGFGLKSWRSQKLDRSQVALLVSSALLLVLFAVVPVNFKLWQFVSPRFLPLGVTMLLGLLPVERWSSRQTKGVAVFAAATMYVGAALGWTASFQQRLWRMMKPVVDGAQARVFPRKLMLPLPLSVNLPNQIDEREGPYAFYQPFVALGDIFAVANDGVVPYTFTVIPQLHGFTLKDDIHRLFPPHPILGDWRLAYSKAMKARNRPKVLELLNLLALYGSEFDGTVLKDITNEHLLFQSRGYEVEWHEGKVWQMKFRGCPVRFVVRGADAALVDEQVRVSYGWFPLEAYRNLSVSRSQTSSELVANVPAAPCGPVRFRVMASSSKGGRVRPMRCRGADATGALLVKLVPGDKEVSCVLSGPKSNTPEPSSP